jgi:hypothetical protein
MISVEWLRATFPRATALIEPHLHVLRKAVSFALIGVVNVLIDTSVFLLAYSYLSASPWALRPLDAFADGCQCVSHTSIVLIAGTAIFGDHCPNSGRWSAAGANGLLPPHVLGDAAARHEERFHAILEDRRY